ncbi:TetR/AcrR family transcriptional regulator [Caulobacter sp. 1776]|uniref:TetR/AcrR family transcriptional regulator n=1 Tax=Caulobacter sp. 1776 TaxID=3156420 RepID=UPI0033977DD1
MDRRVARTRATLQRALIALMLRKGYDAVTVEEICTEADIGRSTFYAHFTSKEDLKRSGLEDQLRGMVQGHPAASGSERDFGFVLPFLEHARDHVDLYRALVGKGGANTTLAMLTRIVSDMVREELAKSPPIAKGPARDMATAFIAGGFVSLVTRWLDDGARLPPERLDVVFRGLVVDGLAHLAEA